MRHSRPGNSENRKTVLSLWFEIRKVKSSAFLSFASFSYIKIIANNEIIIINCQLTFLHDIIRLFRKFRILKTLLITIAYIEKNRFNVVHESKESLKKGKKIRHFEFRELPNWRTLEELWRVNSHDTIVLVCCNRTIRDPTVSLYSCLFCEHTGWDRNLVQDRKLVEFWRIKRKIRRNEY